MTQSAYALAQTQAQVVQHLLTALPNCMAIYAFGSQTRGEATASSDLDLAVLVAGYVPALQLWELSHQVADLVHCDVDLLDLRAASTVMQYQVITTGVPLWSNGLQAALFETYVLSENTRATLAPLPPTSPAKMLQP
ncbi:type VII toxin-antitoxin system MntA family adenylyltransferase antitoxin [Rhodoferax aquaticus]|uniref:Nucleotidyltransferase domain-containing protein n=1 Tax=Rhodoferax aquaticus TaxID=2527691 RepID=A0A515EPH3_9BURK|nr:nucleotidyltransferase domain-containing protein [Rhodoferax aquaticus]QDL54563.1 nucleotidyltransferase domain-containing protein [Rhodoferax aquaticus]